MNLKIALPAAALAVGLLGIGFGTAEAVSSFPPGTIHGCVTGKSRTLEGVYANPAKGLTCPAGSFPLSWQQVNTAGPNGLDVIEVQTQNLTGGDDTATCPADHPYIVGRGGSVASEIVSSGPVEYPNPQGTPGYWIIESSYGATGQGNPGAEAEALCAK